MDFQNFVFTKEERQAPDARESDYCINDSAQNSTLATADPCDDIKLEQPNAAPVDGTDPVSYTHLTLPTILRV